MNKLILLVLVLSSLLSYGKNYQVKLHIKNLPDDSNPILLRIYNGNMYVLDSTALKENETVTFEIPENTNAGLLKAILGMSTYAKYMNGQPTEVNFLFNHEDVELNLDFKNPQESIEVVHSKENSIYQEFQKSDVVFFRKLGLLEQVVLNYPDKDEFYQKALEYYKKYQIQREKFIDKYYNLYKNTLAGKIIKTQKLPFTEGDISREQRDSIFKAQYLDKIEFNDTTLLYTDVYTNKVYQYIQMYMNRNASPRENEANIIQAIDLLVPRLDVNPTIQQHLLQFLIGGFEDMKLEEVLAHISQNYLQQCGGSSDIIKRRLEGYQRMAIGNKVSDFTVMDIGNNPVNLYSTVSPYTLIVFWHTECAHCQALMKDLPNLVNEDFFTKHQVKIIGISIDENKENWEKFSAEHPMEWTNTYIEGSFDSEIASDYNLFATPSMFLIDDSHHIIAKPTTFEELKKNIQAL